MGPKKAEPDPEPEELSSEELEAQQRALAQHTQELSSLEVCGRRTIAELEVVAWKFIHIHKQRSGEAFEERDVYGPRMYLYVRVLTGNRAIQGETLELTCQRTDTADHLKALIEDAYAAVKPLPINQQLSHQGKAFEGAETVQQAGILPNATLHLQIVGWNAAVPPPLRCPPTLPVASKA